MVFAPRGTNSHAGWHGREARTQPCVRIAVAFLLDSQVQGDEDFVTINRAAIGPIGKLLEVVGETRYLEWQGLVTLVVEVASRFRDQHCTDPVLHDKLCDAAPVGRIHAREIHHEQLAHSIIDRHHRHQAVHGHLALGGCCPR
jgi:hypothetical protein